MLDLAQRMARALDRAMLDQPDPDVLDTLYQLDSLACQVRRHAENVLLLFGERIVDVDRQVTSLVDVVLAAAGRIEGWPRVVLGPIADIAVAEHVSGDLIRAVTELVDNAARYSPPNSPIIVGGHLLPDGGALLRIEDEGIGLTPVDVARHNTYLRSIGPVANGASDAADAAHQGLRVVYRALRPHQINVTLVGRNPFGAVASVHIPAGLLWEVPPGTAPGHHATQPAGTFLDPDALPAVGRGRAPVIARPAMAEPDPATAADRLAPGLFDLPTRAPAATRHERRPASSAATRAAEDGAEPTLDRAVEDLLAFDSATGGQPPPGRNPHDDP